jgi:hypothetical protein
MTPYEPGDVLLMRFPFTDLSSANGLVRVVLPKVIASKFLP